MSKYSRPTGSSDVVFASSLTETRIALYPHLQRNVSVVCTTMVLATCGTISLLENSFTNEILYLVS